VCSVLLCMFGGRTQAACTNLVGFDLAQVRQHAPEPVSLAWELWQESSLVSSLTKGQKDKVRHYTYILQCDNICISYSTINQGS
jgi:hypothetical protein